MKKQTALTSENKRIIVANEMATYFETQITPAELACWLSTANEYCSEFKATSNPEGDVKYAIQFLNEIGHDILPRLITCKNQKERIDLLYEQIPYLFENADYSGTKEVLADISANFMKAFVKYTREEGEPPISEFLKIIDCFLILVEMFMEYERLSNQELRKELNLS